jgi:periplasmic divalent cation tolerance protein
MPEKIIVHCTCPTEEEAQRVALHVVGLRLAACAAVTKGVRSFYRWKGALEESEECALTMKSRADLFEELCAEIRKEHSYETPEILAVPVVDGAAGYLAWMDEELRPVGGE